MTVAGVALWSVHLQGPSALLRRCSFASFVASRVVLGGRSSGPTLAARLALLNRRGSFRTRGVACA